MTYLTTCPTHGTRELPFFLELFFMSEEGKPSKVRTARKPRTFPTVSDAIARDAGDNKGILRNIAGPKIKSRRLQLGWTQKRLADEIARISNGEWVPTQPDVRRVEGQRRILADRDLLFVAKVLSCSTAWLLSEEGAPEPSVPHSTDSAELHE
jgi:hypothetical protein